MIETLEIHDEIYEMSRHGQEIMNQIEQSSKPIVAAIAGSCLGGGFEVTLLLLSFLVSCFSVNSLLWHVIIV